MTDASDSALPLPECVAVVGVGQMGLAMALRLRDAGCTVRVHDIDAARVALAVAAGAQPCTDAAHAAADVQALIVAVVDAAQSEAVLFGPGGAAAALRPGSAVLLCPTIAPAQAAHLLQRLQALGLDAIEAPMSGGPVRAREGRMSLMVAAAAPVRARWQALLAHLSNTVFDVGPRFGDGARTKLVNNLLAAIHLAGAAEAFALAQGLGLDAALTLQVVEASSGQSWIASDRLRRALAGDEGVQAQIALLAKDSTLALQEIQQLGMAAEVAPAAQAAFARACAQGHAGEDDSRLWALARAGALGRPG